MGGSFSARVPRSSAEAGYLSTTSRKMKLTGRRKDRMIREKEEEEVNGVVEERQQSDTADDKCKDGVSADPNLSQCSVMSSEQRTVQARSEALTTRKRD